MFSESLESEHKRRQEKGNIEILRAAFSLEFSFIFTSCFLLLFSYTYTFFDFLEPLICLSCCICISTITLFFNVITLLHDTPWSFFLILPLFLTFHLSEFLQNHSPKLIIHVLLCPFIYVIILCHGIQLSWCFSSSKDMIKRCFI